MSKLNEAIDRGIKALYKATESFYITDKATIRIVCLEILQAMKEKEREAVLPNTMECKICGAQKRCNT